MHRFPRLMFLIRLDLLLATCIAAAANPGYAQDAVTATSGSPAAIARIRAEYAAIQREAPRYRQTEHDVYDFSLEGGNSTASTVEASFASCPRACTARRGRGARNTTLRMGG
jgi:hypothetical protein